MCGIAGIYSAKKTVVIEPLRKMAKALAHRGPDGKGFWINNEQNVGFAHRRLSVIDLSDNGAQPMHYQSRYTIIYNGEVYNYIELKAELKKKNYHFTSNSDTEVLLALFAEYGTGCLSKIDGMFAFAIYDNVTKILFLARDRFGEKPLFYTIQDGCFYFASEMKAFFTLGLSKKPCPERMYQYLQWDLVYDGKDGESTFYQNIQQLPPGNFYLIKEDKILQKNQYWDLKKVEINKKISFEDAVEEYKYLLTESIKIRLRSDVSLGSSLSGGLDSTAIVLIINSLKNQNQIQKTFSARFLNFARDEGKFMELAINHGKGIKPEFVWPNADELIEDLEHLMYHQEEPFISGSIYAQYKVMSLAKKKGITVLLDGQGADEQLGGYVKYYYHYLSSLLMKEPILFNQEQKNFNKLNVGFLEKYYVPRRLPLWFIKSRILNRPYKYDKDIRCILKEDMMSNSIGPLLRYADRNSMAFSREIRLPFLSHHLVEFTFTLPTSFIFNKGWSKYILRKSVEKIIPEDIAWRKDKIGYEPPHEKWNDKIQGLIKDIKKNNNYQQHTGGKKVDKKITDWQWLMLNSFNKS